MICRCGCGQRAAWLVRCCDTRQTEPTLEACCEAAKDYLSECAAETDGPFVAARLPQNARANSRAIAG